MKALKMKSLRLLFTLSFLLAGCAAVAQTPAQKSFDQLKSLTGSWEGKTADGKPAQVTFRDTAGGSALMSEIRGHGADDMISMFHLDGANRLLLTHYCSVGNQPRMAASASPDGKTITFDFIDATNLSAPDAGHMLRVVFTVVDANHHTEDWIFADHGKEMKEFFDLRRNEVAQQ
ncbi:MAG: hypothetical protein WB919_19455 [Candidatus Sulfotelmatobacter sp.]